MWYDADQPPI